MSHSWVAVSAVREMLSQIVDPVLGQFSAGKIRLFFPVLDFAAGMLYRQTCWMEPRLLQHCLLHRTRLSWSVGRHRRPSNRIDFPKMSIASLLAGTLTLLGSLVRLIDGMPAIPIMMDVGFWRLLANNLRPSCGFPFFQRRLGSIF